MRSCVMALVLVLAGVGNAFAQQPAAFGVKVGANFANLNFDGEGADISLDRRTGLIGGLFVVVPADRQLALQAEALFSQKGAQSEEGDASGSIKLNYLEVPILARISSPASNGTSFHLLAGPSLGFRTSAKAESSFDGEEESEDIDDDVKRFDLGLVIGAGVEFGRLVVDGRYTWGLTDLNKEEEEGIKIKNRVFSVMAGFRF